MLYHPYVGPGLWVSIKHRFGPRMPEWFMAAHMLSFGLILLAPNDVFDQPAYSGFTALLLSENHLGILMFLFGALRLGGLIVNGARRDVTPRIRQASAAVGCLIWFGVSYGFTTSGVFSTWLAIYPWFGIAELFNIHRAAHDEGTARHGKYS